MSRRPDCRGRRSWPPVGGGPGSLGRREGPAGSRSGLLEPSLDGGWDGASSTPQARAKTERTGRVLLHDDHRWVGSGEGVRGTGTGLNW